MNEGKPVLLCRVCGDKASGKHYGVASCDGCRGFFKRSIRRNLDYVCKENNRCIVDVTRRNQCQACRFSKCVRVNMKKDAVQHERAPRPAVHLNHLQKLGYPVSPKLSQPFPGYTSDQIDIQSSRFLDVPRFSEFVPADIAQFYPLLGASVGSFSGFNPFSIPLLQTPVHYQMASGYFPTNLLYSTPVCSAGLEVAAHRDTTNLVSPSEEQVFTTAHQPTAERREDEVSSSEEASNMNPQEGSIASGSGRSSAPASARGSVSKAQKEAQKLLLTVLDYKLLDTTGTLLYATSKWLRYETSYLHLRPVDRQALLLQNWREVFILTAAQCGLKFGGTYNTYSAKLQTTVRILENTIRKVRRASVDDIEYDLLKAIVLYRLDSVQMQMSLIESYQDNVVIYMQSYVAHKGPLRFGKLLVLLPYICSFLGQGFLEDILFPGATLAQINAILLRAILRL